MKDWLYRFVIFAFVVCMMVLVSGCAVQIPGMGGEQQPQPAIQPPVEPTVAPTATPEPSPTPVVLDSELRFEEGGLSLQYPSGWHTMQEANRLALSSDEAAMKASNPSEHLVLVIDSTPLEATGNMTGDMDIEAIFETSKRGPEQVGYVVSSTLAITVDGHSGLQADLSANGGAGRLVVFSGPSQIVRVLGQSAPESWSEQQQVFEEIVNSIAFFTPAVPPTPTPALQQSQPTITTMGPPGFLIRLGSNEGPPQSRFVLARGMDVSSDGTVYLAESSQGIWVFAPDGTLLRIFGEEILGSGAYDVDIGPDGDLYVADYAHNSIVRFTTLGEFIASWGGIGNGAGQFGSQSPQRIAVGIDGIVYALDSHSDPATGETVHSIALFNSENGSYINRITLASNVAPNDIAVDNDGTIYIADASNRAVFRISSSGDVVETLGEEVNPEGITAGALDIDNQGNLYVATWDEGIINMSADGALIARGGNATASGILPAPGQFSLPNGIAVAPGDAVWISDNSGEYSAISALRLFGTSDFVASNDEITSTRAISEGGYLRQWAVDAVASSHYGEEYAPDGAVGPPDVEGCQDSTNAWASATPDTLETLELAFLTPMFASQVNIYQNHQPGFVSEVELLDERGNWTSVYKGKPQLQSVCPYKMEVTFEPSLFRVVGVRLTIDQREDANWSEIDAVELMGTP